MHHISLFLGGKYAKTLEILGDNYSFGTLEMSAFIAQLRQMICRKCSAGIPINFFFLSQTFIKIIPKENKFLYWQWQPV